MPFPEGISPALKSLYGVIERSVNERASTTQLWEAIRAANPRGVSLGRNAAAQVSVLRGYAAANRNASEHLSRLADNEGIGGRAVHTPVWSNRDANTRAAVPMIAARVQLIVPSTAALTEGASGDETGSRWVTLHFDSLPATAGQLREQIEASLTTGVGPNGQEIGSPPPEILDVGRVELLSL